MLVNYRCAAHAVTSINDKYGYYRSIVYNSKKTGKISFRTELPTKNEWPLDVYVKVTLHNHEDLTRFTDIVLDAFDSLRGEFGEKEVRSPSSIVLLR
jgi:hypothetical protein